MRGSVREAALRTALWLLLGGWFGSFSLFAFVVAPAAFQVLPSTELAGRLVGPVLAALHLYGAAAGLLLAALSFALGRGRLLGTLPIILAALCLVSHFGVTAEIAEIRDAAFGPEGNATAAARFATLHRISMILFAAVGLGTLGLVALHATSDARALRRG